MARRGERRHSFFINKLFHGLALDSGTWRWSRWSWSSSPECTVALSLSLGSPFIIRVNIIKATVISTHSPRDRYHPCPGHRAHHTHACQFFPPLGLRVSTVWGRFMLSIFFIWTTSLGWRP